MNERSIEIGKARNYFALFAKAVFPQLVFSDFHMKYYRVLHRFAKGDIRKLIVTIPPQHGKSQGATRILPAFLFGMNPDVKVAIASYSDGFARKFNRDIQRIIDSPVYRELFPTTRIKGKGSGDSTGYVRNSGGFEIVGREGSLMAVGRSGALTGNAVDVMIMDDLYRDAMEGNSPIIRDSVWEWYLSVVKTRLHNDSRELIVFTRWHEDDLIGRIEEKDRVRELKDFGEVVPEFQGWWKLNFEAIKEGDPTPIDGRKAGAALWPERHSAELLEEKRRLDVHRFNCMYQGRPDAREGLLFGDRFQTYEALPPTVKKANYTDTADLGGDMLCSVCYETGTDGKIYITDVLYTDRPMEETEPAVARMLEKNDTRVAYIESNNGGRGFARNVGKLAPAVSIRWFHQNGNKESRILTNSATVLHNVRMPVGWMERWPVFYRDLVGYKRLFRANRHDDAADVLTGIVEKEVHSGRGGVRISFV